MEKYVLIIEDDPIIQKAYQLKFAKQNIKLRAVSDGRQAQQLIENEAKELPAVVILDLMLPYVSGFELLELMRKTNPWKEIPVIVLSNLSQEVDLTRVRNLGVKDYLIKADTRIDEVIERVMGYMK